MNNVTRFPGTRGHADAPHEELTSAHRFLIYSIMDLAMDISLLTDHKAGVDYSGTVHTLTVDVVPPQNLAKRKGGNDSFEAVYRAHIQLPPGPLAGEGILQELADVITSLQHYLPTTGGAA